MNIVTITKDTDRKCLEKNLERSRHQLSDIDRIIAKSSSERAEISQLIKELEELLDKGFIVDPKMIPS